ncbi:MAG: iron-containing alcohol dehydrogenase [Thermoguttaceae bacterium]|nr:iron-containing alcohol dehydrogenase [Thermoguttaceae bacterium]
MLPLMNSEIVLPSRILFGSGVRKRLAEVAQPLGKRAWFVLGSRQFRASHSHTPALLDELVQMLRKVGIEAKYLTTISREPTIEDVDQAVTMLRRGLRPSDFLIAVGGGSAMDLAKATAALVVQSESAGEEMASVRDFLEGLGTGRKLIQTPLPVIAMPTTAGTGAEATKNAVITSHNPPCKKSLRHPSMLPQTVIVDPDLLATLPPKVLAASGMDAITQLIESAISCRTNRFCRSLATAALAPAIHALPILFHAATISSSRDEFSTHDSHGLSSVDAAHSSDFNSLGEEEATRLREARETMAYAALVSGISLANSGLGLAHGIAAALGVHAGISHGVACAMLLPVALRVNAIVAAEAIRSLEQSLTMTDHTNTESHLNTQSNSGSLEQRIVAMNQTFGIPSMLSRLGVQASQIPAIAHDSKGNSLSGNPRPLSESELIEILNQIL